jgi:hypothetical protein
MPAPNHLNSEQKEKLQKAIKKEKILTLEKEF